jgi:hypothetical protein
MFNPSILRHSTVESIKGRQLINCVEEARGLAKVDLHHGLINYVDTKAKCCHLKKLTCKGTLPFSLVQLSTPSPLPCVNRYTVYTNTVCKGGGVGGSVGDRIL